MVCSIFNKSISSISTALALLDSKAIDKFFLEHATKYKTAKAYVCGPAETTKKIKTIAFLAGIPSNRIYSDTFVY